MKSFVVTLTLFTVALTLNLSADSDRFEKFKSKYTQAKMIKIDAIIELESEIFESVDTAYAVIYLTDDGRYSAKLNDDLYLYDGKCAWEYSYDNNQVAKNCFDQNNSPSNELLVFKNLDKHYKAMAIERANRYSLKLNAEYSGSLPDSMSLNLNNPDSPVIEYYDINDELNRISILSDSVFNEIDPSVFIYDLPDSVDLIIMP